MAASLSETVSERGEKSFPAKHIAELRGTLPSRKIRHQEKTTHTPLLQGKNCQKSRFVSKEEQKFNLLNNLLAVLNPLCRFPGQHRQGFWVSPWQRSPFHSTFSAHSADRQHYRHTTRLIHLLTTAKRPLQQNPAAPKAGNFKGILTGISLLPSPGHTGRLSTCLGAFSPINKCSFAHPARMLKIYTEH